MQERLKLLAESEQGLTVISAALQDAIARVSDIKFNKRAATLSLITSRFMRENDGAKRVLSTLYFNNILALRSRGILRQDPDAFMVLLAIEYEAEKGGSSGTIKLLFAGGGELCADAEYIEARLIDTALPRPTKREPLHPDV